MPQCTVAKSLELNMPGFEICGIYTITAVILRRSPFFTASLEGWATGASGDPSRRRARMRGSSG
jgi:hypothetical protein